MGYDNWKSEDPMDRWDNEGGWQDEEADVDDFNGDQQADGWKDLYDGKSELEWKDKVVEDLKGNIEDFLTFSTVRELLKIIVDTF